MHVLCRVLYDLSTQHPVHPLVIHTLLSRQALRLYPKVLVQCSTSSILLLWSPSWRQPGSWAAMVLPLARRTGALLTAASLVVMIGYYYYYYHVTDQVTTARRTAPSG